MGSTGKGKKEDTRQTGMDGQTEEEGELCCFRNKLQLQQ